STMLHRPRADGAVAPLDRIGVRLHDPNRLHRYAQLLGRDLGERRFVPLPEGGGAAADDDRAGRLDMDATPLRPDALGGDLDVDGETDAKLQPVAVRTPARLFRPEL